MGFLIALPIPTFPTCFPESSPQYSPLGSGPLHPVFHPHSNMKVFDDMILAGTWRYTFHLFGKTLSDLSLNVRSSGDEYPHSR